MRLKKFYTSREVAALTGLTARQLQWWDSRRLFTAALATQRTEAGGFTERRYTPLDVLELQVLADLRRRAFPFRVCVAFSAHCGMSSESGSMRPSATVGR